MQASKKAGAWARRKRSSVAAGWCGWMLAAALLFGTGPAAAAISYCVGTAAEFDAALAVATSPVSQTVVIKLKQGTYHVGASSMFTHWHEFNAMQWLGGYNDDCSERSVRASNTVIDGDGVHMEGRRMHGDLKIEGLRFQNIAGDSLFFDTYDDSEDVDFLVFGNEFLGIGFSAACYECDGVQVQFVNNLVTAAPADGFYALYGYSDDVYVYLANNTIVGSGQRGVYVESDGVNTFANNVIRNNPTRDIWVDGDTDGSSGSARYYDNLYGSRYGDEGSGSYGTLLSRWLMTFSRPRFLSSVRATCQGAQAVWVASNIASRARV